jgi:hypothetical protein
LNALAAAFIMKNGTHLFASKRVGGRIIPANYQRYWRFVLRKLALFVFVCSFFSFASLASAQQGDAMVGFGTILSSGSNSSCPFFSTSCIGPEKGGLFTTISGDIVFHRRLGFNIEANWRTRQGVDDGGQLYRPILFDFNGLYQPQIRKKIGADLMAGVGWQTTRFYGFQETTSCLEFGSCYTSNNHFLVHFGGGVRYYVWGNFFLRPEAHFYHILNNSDVFTNGNVVRIGASIGYTIGRD